MSSSFPRPITPFLFLLFTFVQCHSILLAESFPLLCPHPTFPFSAIPGRGHPSFQIDCRSNHSILTINNISFSVNNISVSVHGHRPNSINLFPFPSDSCHNLTLNLSATPFHPSHTTCSRLACSDPNLTLPNCKITAKIFPNCSQSSRHYCRSSDSTADLLKFGIELEWDSHQDPYFSDCYVCQEKNDGVCDYNESSPSKPFICFPLQESNGRDRVALFSTLFAFACMLLVSTLAVAIFRCGGMRWTAAAEREEDPTAIFLHRHRSSHLLPPVFTYEELESSTNRFDSKRKIGDGGFGSVYLAQLSDGQIVAVKKLHRRHAAAAAATSKSFCNEVLILSSISHPNLVKLHGYCCDPRGLCLVYDYVPNGTLADHLHGSRSVSRKESLTWQLRLDIALETAMAIEYLHFCVEPVIVHRDITSSNIFIEKDMAVKVGDFGLSRLLVYTDSSPTYVWTGPQGTPGYLDPDYHRSFRLTEKSDTYSFGVVLFELITGMKAVDLKRNKREVALADLVVARIQIGELDQVIDRDLAVEGESVGTVERVAELGFRCVATDKDDRPDAREVVAELRRIRDRVRGQKGSGAGAAADVCKG